MVLWILKMLINKEKNTKCKYNATNAQLGQFFMSKVALPIKLYSILVHIHQSLSGQLVELDKYNNIDRFTHPHLKKTTNTLNNIMENMTLTK